MIRVSRLACYQISLASTALFALKKCGSADGNVRHCVNICVFSEVESTLWLL